MAKILVVDDELEVRRTLDKLLTVEGHEVITAGSVGLGIRALTKAREKGEKYQIALIVLCTFIFVL